VNPAGLMDASPTLPVRPIHRIAPLKTEQRSRARSCGTEFNLKISHLKIDCVNLDLRSVHRWREILKIAVTVPSRPTAPTAPISWNCPATKNTRSHPGRRQPMIGTMAIMIIARIP